jgi:hypothetical protein
MRQSTLSPRKFKKQLTIHNSLLHFESIKHTLHQKTLKESTLLKEIEIEEGKLLFKLRGK